MCPARASERKDCLNAMQWNLDAYASLLAQWDKRRAGLLENQKRLTADLPLKFYRQQAHFTTPASNLEMVTKAIEKGSAAAPKVLEKLGISVAEVADALRVPDKEIERELSADPQSPFVMVDGEDAQALRDDVVERGRQNAIKVFREAKWGRTLRFYRPSGLNLDYCLRDILIVLGESGKGLAPESFPVDGIVWPKTEHPEELALVVEVLGEVEKKLGLKENQIKLEFLVESGWAAAQLPLLVKTTIHRLAGIIWGIADYSADIGLPEIINDHPVCDWVRMTIVNMAGGIGVPSIDNMTVNYPVANASLSAGDNKKLVLSRMKEVYDDAVHGQKLGMDGKWVGHPLQLLCVRLAYRLAFTEEEFREELEKIEAYKKAVDAEVGATIIKGVMSDRATDRHARWKIRKAIARGHLGAAKGVELGLITKEEAAQLGQ
jgi:citrate lyase beta subunit